ncbi:Heavy-metal resistance [Prosthecobacter debontii]|uniref:Heavy-metal resistance n=1 Tax=Prosthecobacter debontii TaxID=48467 RepID=A0A1T4X6Q0_9BACT|nr:periplasmic heavy metal sensor [Prosthecobacter debontii]SKA85226.1 Heavy-metal resistance [Prosthecobacter debontii]
MKRGFLILLTALLVGIVGYFVTRQPCCEASGEGMATHDGGSLLPELKWLHHELKLTDEQFAKVKERHLAYRPTCEALCMKVAASQKKVQTLAQAGNIAAPELSAALEEQAAVRAECQKAMLKHLHETAAVMSPDQAKHYLDIMLPQIIGPDAGHSPGGH